MWILDCCSLTVQVLNVQICDCSHQRLMQLNFIFKCCGTKQGELRYFLLYMQNNICMTTTFLMSSSGKMLKILEEGNGFLGSISEKPVGCDSPLKVWGKALINLKKKRKEGKWKLSLWFSAMCQMCCKHERRPLDRKMSWKNSMGCPGGKPKSSDSPNIGEQRILMSVH